MYIRHNETNKVYIAEPMTGGMVMICDKDMLETLFGFDYQEISLSEFLEAKNSEWINRKLDMVNQAAAE